MIPAYNQAGNKIMEKPKISYGSGKISEHPDWINKFPLGPVHWDVWRGNTQIGEAIPANKLQSFMVNNSLLILW